MFIVVYRLHMGRSSGINDRLFKYIECRILKCTSPLIENTAVIISLAGFCSSLHQMANFRNIAVLGVRRPLSIVTVMNSPLMSTLGV